MKLDEYLSSKNISDAEFAATIDRDRSSVSRLRRGETKPDWNTAHRIYAVTSGAVTPNDFLPEQPADGAALPQAPAPTSEDIGDAA